MPPHQGTSQREFLRSLELNQNSPEDDDNLVEPPPPTGAPIFVPGEDGWDIIMEPLPEGPFQFAANHPGPPQDQPQGFLNILGAAAYNYQGSYDGSDDEDAPHPESGEHLADSQALQPVQDNSPQQFEASPSVNVYEGNEHGACADTCCPPQNPSVTQHFETPSVNVYERNCHGACSTSCCPPQNSSVPTDTDQYSDFPQQFTESGRIPSFQNSGHFPSFREPLDLPRPNGYADPHADHLASFPEHGVPGHNFLQYPVPDNIPRFVDQEPVQPLRPHHMNFPHPSNLTTNSHSSQIPIYAFPPHDVQQQQMYQMQPRPALGPNDPLPPPVPEAYQYPPRFVNPLPQRPPEIVVEYDRGRPFYYEDAAQPDDSGYTSPNAVYLDEPRGDAQAANPPAPARNQPFVAPNPAPLMPHLDLNVVAQYRPSVNPGPDDYHNPFWQPEESWYSHPGGPFALPHPHARQPPHFAMPNFTNQASSAPTNRDQGQAGWNPEPYIAFNGQQESTEADSYYPNAPLGMPESRWFHGMESENLQGLNVDPRRPYSEHSAFEYSSMQPHVDAIEPRQGLFSTRLNPLAPEFVPSSQNQCENPSSTQDENDASERFIYLSLNENESPNARIEELAGEEGAPNDSQDDSSDTKATDNTQGLPFTEDCGPNMAENQTSSQERGVDVNALMNQDKDDQGPVIDGEKDPEVDEKDITDSEENSDTGATSNVECENQWLPADHGHNSGSRSRLTRSDNPLGPVQPVHEPSMSNTNGQRTYADIVRGSKPDRAAPEESAQNPSKNSKSFLNRGFFGGDSLSSLRPFFKLSGLNNLRSSDYCESEDGSLVTAQGHSPLHWTVRPTHIDPNPSLENVMAAKTHVTPESAHDNSKYEPDAELDVEDLKSFDVPVELAIEKAEDPQTGSRGNTDSLRGSVEDLDAQDACSGVCRDGAGLAQPQMCPLTRPPDSHGTRSRDGAPTSRHQRSASTGGTHKARSRTMVSRNAREQTRRTRSLPTYLPVPVLRQRIRRNCREVIPRVSVINRRCSQFHCDHCLRLDDMESFLYCCLFHDCFHFHDYSVDFENSSESGFDLEFTTTMSAAERFRRIQASQEDDQEAGLPNNRRTSLVMNVIVNHPHENIRGWEDRDGSYFPRDDGDTRVRRFPRIRAGRYNRRPLIFYQRLDRDPRAPAERPTEMRQGAPAGRRRHNIRPGRRIPGPPLNPGDEFYRIFFYPTDPPEPTGATGARGDPQAPGDPQNVGRENGWFELLTGNGTNQNYLLGLFRDQEEGDHDGPSPGKAARSA